MVTGDGHGGTETVNRLNPGGSQRMARASLMISRAHFKEDRLEQQVLQRMAERHQGLPVENKPAAEVTRNRIERTDSEFFVDDESRFLGRRVSKTPRKAKDYKGESGLTREPRPFCSSTTLSLRIHSTG